MNTDNKVPPLKNNVSDTKPPKPRRLKKKNY